MGPKTIEAYADRPAWKEKNPEYRLMIVLYTQGELNKERLQELTKLEPSEFNKGLKNMIERENISEDKTSEEAIYSLTPDFKAWARRYL